MGRRKQIDAARERWLRELVPKLEQYGPLAREDYDLLLVQATDELGPPSAWSRYVELRVRENLEPLEAVVQLACELGRTPESTAASLRRARKQRLDAHQATADRFRDPAWMEVAKIIFARVTVPGGSTMDLVSEVPAWEQ